MRIHVRLENKNEDNGELNGSAIQGYDFGGLIFRNKINDYQI